MADIDVERKGGMGWLWWVLGLILLALIIWWIAAAGDDDAEVAEVVEPAPVVTPTTTPEPIAQGPLCVAQVLSQPNTYVGQSLGDCEMRVAEVVSDRGFWIEENGQRVFVVINEGAQQNPQPGVGDVSGMPAEKPDVNAGQTIRISQAMVMDDVDNLVGELDAQTRQIAGSQPWFLQSHGRNIQIMGAGTP